LLDSLLQEIFKVSLSAKDVVDCPPGGRS